MKRSPLFAAALAALVPAVAQAQEAPPVTVGAPSDPLTLSEVTTTVLERHPLLRAVAQDRAIAAADMLSAEGGFDPSLRARVVTIPTGPYPSDRLETIVEQPTALWGTKFFGGYRVSRGDFAPYDGKLVTGDWGEARVGAAVPLWRDGPIDKRRAALQKAELGTEAARLSVAQARIEAVRSASLKYWDWVGTGRKLEIVRDLLGIAVARDAALAARVARGDIPAFERAENERVIYQRRAQVAAAERAVQNAAIELSLFYRAASGEPVVPPAGRLPESFPEPAPRAFDVQASEREALARRPELRRIDVLRDQTRVDRALANNQRKLGVDLVVAGAKDFGPGDPRILKPELEVGVLVDVPILTRVQDGRVRAAEASYAKLSEQQRFARDRVVADVRDAASAVDQAQERIAAARREIATARQLVAAEMQRFELGEGTLLLVNLREQALAEAQQREIDALSDYQKALANQRAAVAAPPGGASPP